MIIAVSALGPSLDDRVDERFGRARYFIMTDTDTPEWAEVIDNKENRDAMQGAGIAAAEIVSRSGAKAVITGHLGPKAFRALEASGVVGYEGTGRSVRDAVGEFVSGNLATLSASPTGHVG